MTALLLAVSLAVVYSGGAAAKRASAAEALPEDARLSYAAGEIEALMESGVMRGYEDGTFKPDRPVTRAELAKVIALALGLREAPEAAKPFADVGGNSWYAGYVGALAQTGIATGVTADAFAPDREVSREELAVLIVRAMGLERDAELLNDRPAFGDADSVASWASAHVALAQQIGLLNGAKLPDGTLVFRPKAKADRQAVARLAYEMLAKREAFAASAKVRAAGARGVEIASLAEDGSVLTVSDGTELPVSNALRRTLLHPGNARALQGAVVRFRLAEDGAIRQITGLALTASGKPADDGRPEFSANVAYDGRQGEISGDLTVKGDYTTVRNTNVTGSLVVDASVEHDFLAVGVKASGTVYVRGGDSNTVAFERAELGAVSVEKADVKVAAADSTSIGQVDVKSDGVSFVVQDGSVNVGRAVIEGDAVLEGEGEIPEVVVAKGGVEVKVELSVPKMSVREDGAVIAGGGAIGEISVEKPDAAVTLNTTSKIDKVTLKQAGVVLRGSAQVGRLTVESTGETKVELEKKPEQVDNAAGGTVVETPPAAGAPGGSTGGGSPGGNTGGGTPGGNTGGGTPGGNTGGGSPGGNANARPAAKTIQPFTLTLGQGAVTFEASHFATDSVGDTLKVAAASAETSGIVGLEATAQGKLVVTPQAAGTTQITVTVADAAGETVNATMSVTVNLGIHLFGDVRLHGVAKEGVTVRVRSGDGSVDYAMAYGEPEGETNIGRRMVGDTARGSDYVHYYVDVPAGEYTVTVTRGDLAASASIAASASGDTFDFPYGKLHPKKLDDLALGTPAEPAASATIEFLGHSAFVLRTEQEGILIDPWRPYVLNLPAYSIAGQAELTLIAITHGHDDHMYTDAAPAVERIVWGTDPATHAFRSVTDEVYGDVTISTVPLNHFWSTSYMGDDVSAGFLFETGGKRILHMGDGMGPIIDGYGSLPDGVRTAIQGVDLLLMPIGDFTGSRALDDEAPDVQFDEVLQFIDDVNPKVVVPIHAWNTKPLFLSKAAAAGLEVVDRPSKFELAALPQGGTVVWNMASTVNFAPPQLLSASVNGDRLVLTFNETMDEAVEQVSTFLFQVSADGTPVDVQQIDAEGSSIALTLAAPVSAGQQVAVSYPGIVRNAAGIPAAAADNAAVTNDTAAPMLGKITATATDATIAVNATNMQIDPGNDSFTITIATGTFKDSVSKDDIALAGLPGFLEATVARIAPNRLRIGLIGAAAMPLTADVPLALVVRASAVNEPGAVDSDAVALTLLKYAADSGAPELTGYTTMPGFEAGAMMIMYTPGDGNTAKYLIQDAPFAQPNAGDPVPAEANGVGGDILPPPLGNLLPGKYVGLYEVDPDGKIVRFASFQVTADMLAQEAPAITGYLVEPGTASGSVKITYAAGAGNALRLDTAGGGMKPIAGGFVSPYSTSAYAAGDDIPGVAAGQTIRLYETDADGKAVKYTDITLTADMIQP